MLISFLPTLPLSTVPGQLHSTLYHSWNPRLRQLRPSERKTRLSIMTWLLVGLYQSRSVHLSKVAEKDTWQGNLAQLDRADNAFSG